jgi:hypothetical protein
VADVTKTLPTGTVVGRFTAADGRPVGGSVVFTPSTRVLLDDEIVVGAPVVVDLDEEGSFGDGVQLLATDVASTRPTGFTYRVSFGRLRSSGSGVAFPSIDIAVPAGKRVDLGDVAPIPSSGGTATVIDPTTALRAEAAAGEAEASATDARSSAERAEAAAAGAGSGGGSGPGVDAIAREAAAEAQRTADEATAEAHLAQDAAADASRVAAGAAATAAGKYTLPTSGVPAGSMSDSVRASLGRADSALQSAPVTTVAGKAGAVTLAKGDVGLSQVDNTADVAKPVSTATQAALAGKADLVGGLIPSSQIPAVALLDPVVVASQAAMLALTSAQVQRGDVAIRTDGAGTFVLNAADPSVLTNWLRINSPTDAVTSVNGQSGTVALGKNDVGLGNVANTAPADLPVSTAAQQALDGKAPTSHSHTASQVSDSTTVGRSLVTAVDAAAARTAIGAGTSSLGLGSTSSTAKRGDYAPAAADISDASTVGRSVLKATDAAAGRSALGITGTGADGAQGPQGLTGNVLLLPAGVTTTPSDTKAGTLVLVRA